MSQKFIKRGDCWYVTSEEAQSLERFLPGGYYVLSMDQFENLTLRQSDAFEMPKRIYGRINEIATRVLTTYLQRSVGNEDEPPRSTGALFSGEKGSGKTLLAKLICKRAVEDFDIPIIVINAPYGGNKLNAVIEGIEQQCIVLFDEFEKVYDRKIQEPILTLLDGVVGGAKLFLFTSNDVYGLNSHMHNRPGRIFYSIDFSGLDVNFIRQYCIDNLKDKSYVDGVCGLSMAFEAFNFDMLASLVEEMNRYDLSPDDALLLLNINESYEGVSDYIVTMYSPKGDVYESEHLCGGDAEWTGRPLHRGGFNISVYDGKKWQRILFKPSHLRERNVADERYTFVNPEGYRVVLKKDHAHNGSYIYGGASSTASTL